MQHIYSKTSGFRSDIQGLRAIAVLGVVAYHANESLLSGGFTGVDVFFVISGFLITRILLADLVTGNYSIIEFYRRRITRLFPALYTVLGFTLITGFLLLPPVLLKELAKTALATVLFGSNIDFLFRSGYFDGDANLKPLLHTWSLAVEEQFYIVFPVLLALVWRRARAQLGLILLASAVLSLSTSIVVTQKYAAAAFYLAPARAFELLLGAIVAVRMLPQLHDGRLRDSLSIVGLGMIAAAFIGFDSTTSFPGYAALLPCIGAALVIYSGQDAKSLGGRLISGRALCAIGDISYSLYLWHWPLLAFARHYFMNEVPPTATLALVALAVLLAYLSYNYIERPAIATRLTSCRVLISGAVAMSVSALGMIGIQIANGIPSRFSPAANKIFAAAGDFNHERNRCHSVSRHMIPYSANCTFGAPDVPPDTAVWADSHGAELVVALGEQASAAGRSVMQITASACPPSLDYTPRLRPLCADHNHATLDSLVRDQRIQTVVLAINYAAYPDSDWPRLADGFERLVDQITTTGKRIVVMGQIPIMRYDPPAGLGMLVARNLDPGAYGLPRIEYDRSSSFARSTAQRVNSRGNITIVDVTSALCDANYCPAYRDGVLYFNRDHLSVAGARRVVRATNMYMFSPRH